MKSKEESIFDYKKTRELLDYFSKIFQEICKIKPFTESEKKYMEFALTYN